MPNQDKQQDDQGLLASLAEIEKEPTDQEIYESNPVPNPLDGGEGGDDVELVSGAPTAEVPKRYGPFEVTELRDAKDNMLERPQRSVIATLSTLSGKRYRFLVSAFNEKVHLFDDVQVGGTYNFRGIVKRKIAWVNGEKRVSFYLNIE